MPFFANNYEAQRHLLAEISGHFKSQNRSRCFAFPIAIPSIFGAAFIGKISLQAKGFLLLQQGRGIYSMVFSKTSTVQKHKAEGFKSFGLVQYIA